MTVALTPKSARYAPSGLLALAPQAHGLDFIVGAPAAAIAPNATVVDICGPLTFAGWLFDTYDAIESRVAAACLTDAPYVILRVNSPGGEVAGAFDCARAIKAIAKASNKKLIVWCAAMCASAAYALASAADEIWVSDSAEIGSIGVINAMCDETAQDAAKGVKYAIIASGAHKADGNPHLPITEAVLERKQAQVNQMAEIFFSLVKANRGIEAKPLEAGIFVGEAAVTHGLADRVSTWAELITAIGANQVGSIPTLGANLSETASRGAIPKSIMAKADDEKPNKDEDATRAALVADSNSDDEKKATRAKKALAAYDKDEEPEKEKAAVAAAPSAEFPDKDKKDDKDAVAAANAATADFARSLALANARVAALEAKAALEDRNSFVASRPDISKEMWGSFAALPLDTVKSIVATIPKGEFKSVVEVTDAPLRGGRASLGSMTAAEALASLPPNPELDARMGLSKIEYGVEEHGNVLVLGASRVVGVKK